MNENTMMFLLLRKNSKMLKEFVNDIKTPDVKTRRRKQIIDVKRKLSSLKHSQFMLVKTIATELHRFEIIEATRKFKKGSDDVSLVINDKVIMECLPDSQKYGANSKEVDPEVIFDKIHGIYFILTRDVTIVDDIVLFEGADHEWFKGVYLSLREAKDAEEKLLEMQRVHEEKQRILNRKETLLAKYYT
jgi:hypothetical protein